jgi:acyl-CoA thioester hydrolase
MIKNITKQRIRYAETDQMGVVYHGNYPQFFEIGRVEMMRQMGTTYKKLEATGILMPVREFGIRFKKSALYDELIEIHTHLKKVPDTRITFEHEIFNEQGELLVTGFVELVFVNRASKKPMRAPDDFVARVLQHGQWD